MGAFAELLGPSLVGTAENSKIRRCDTRKTDEALADKHVGLLFAADWCAPVLQLRRGAVLRRGWRAGARRAGRLRRC